jgi:F-type H+-transporting ATPase subunit b
MSPLLAGILVLLAPAIVLASGGGGHGEGVPHINWWTWDMHAPPVGWFLLDFAIFVFGLVYFTKKPIRQAFKARHEAIKKTIDDNTHAATRARDKYATARERLASIERESKELIERIRSEGSFEKERIVEAARDYVQRLHADTKTMLSQETNATRERLRADVAAVVLARAEEVIARELTQHDRERMVDEAIDEIEESEAPPPQRRRGTDRRSSADESGEAA